MYSFIFANIRDAYYNISSLNESLSDDTYAINGLSCLLDATSILEGDSGSFEIWQI